MIRIKEHLKKLLTIRFALGAIFIAATVVTCAFLIARTYPVVTFSSTLHVSSTLLESHPIGVSLVTLALIIFLAGIEMRAPSGDSKIRLFLTFIFALIAPLTATAIFISFSDNILPDIERDLDKIRLTRFGKYGTFLKNADAVTLFSIESLPYENEGNSETPELFHEYKILGLLDIQDESSIHSIRNDLNKRIYSGIGEINYMCFEPRHGLRAYQTGVFKDYLICFHCRNLVVFDSTDEYGTSITLEGGNKNLYLNAILDEAGIKREQPPSE